MYTHRKSFFGGDKDNWVRIKSYDGPRRVEINVWRKWKTLLYLLEYWNEMLGWGKAPLPSCLILIWRYINIRKTLTFQWKIKLKWKKIIISKQNTFFLSHHHSTAIIFKEVKFIKPFLVIGKQLPCLVFYNKRLNSWLIMIFGTIQLD